MTINPILHYEVLAEFNHQYYKDLLTYDHLQDGQIRVDKVAFTDGSIDDFYNFWGWKLEKDGRKYLLACADSTGRDIDLKNVMPIKVLQSQKVAYRGEVFHVILDYASAKPKAVQTMPFKTMVDKLASLKHDNPDHQKLLWLMGISQMYGRANYRVCTPAGFGKDSVIATMGALVGKCGAIVKPSRAKLEYRASLYHWFAVNEVTRVPKADWEEIEPFLLDAGAMLPSIEKQTRAFGRVGERIDISQLSLSLLYNDIDHISDRESFIDFKGHKALLDRFPAFRFWGRYQEDFNEIRKTDIRKLVSTNSDEIKSLIYAFTFYRQNYMSMLHGWNREGLKSDISERWKTSIGVLLNIVDLYCDSQTEFDGWVRIINEALDDYEYMLEFDSHFEKAKKKWSTKETRERREKLKNLRTYKERIEFLTKEGDVAATTYSDGHGLWQ